MQSRWIVVGALLVVGAAAALVAYAPRGDSGSGAAARSTTIPQAGRARLEAARLGDLPLAPRSARVDLAAPPFSHPTRVTNRLFPIADLRSAVLSGTVDGKPFKVETTLLPETRIVEWPEGRPVETLVSQYVAYLDGRIEEVALDFYAQADDGSVWYFGEDVFNYAHGVIADTEGTWLAGKEGPAAMIMPAHPRVGDAYFPENVPGLVFEQVTVKSVDETVRGPRGAVRGAMIGEELHQDGMREDKTFAPGYGEFFTGSGGDVEALAVAVPVDRLAGRPPAALETIAAGADRVSARAGAHDWTSASAAVATIGRAWNALKSTAMPPRLGPRLRRALGILSDSVARRDSVRARRAALNLADAALDVELRTRPPEEIDRARFELWARKLVVDASAGDAAGVRGDLATLEWIRDRIAQTFDKVALTRIDAHAAVLRTRINDEDLPAAAAEATRLLGTLHDV